MAERTHLPTMMLRGCLFHYVGLVAWIATVGCQGGQPQKEGSSSVDPGNHDEMSTESNSKKSQSTGADPGLSDSTQSDVESSSQSSSASTLESESGTESVEPKSEQPQLPSVTGTCPAWDREVLRFSPSTLQKSRRVRVYGPQDPTKKGGALVIFWHGMGAHPTQAPRSLGKMVKEITGEGGWLVAPYPDPAALPVPWFSFFEDRMDDYLLADEIVACAVRDKLIDPRRIHVLGMSAGGFQAGTMSFERSNYVASVAMYSGGFLEERPIPKLQDPSNPFAAMVLHGGSLDQILHVRYRRTSAKYLNELSKGDQFGILCNHASGHTMPSSAHASIWKFFQDHPYKVHPEPYRNGLPDGFPDYCE